MQAPYSGSLSRAAQIASVANSHDPARSETSPGRSRFTAAITTPGISNRTAWPTGTVQGKSLPIRKSHSSIPIESLEEHEQQIEIAPAEAERDRQQNRGRRGEGDRPRRTPSRSLGGGAPVRTGASALSWRIITEEEIRTLIRLLQPHAQSWDRRAHTHARGEPARDTKSSVIECKRLRRVFRAQAIGEGDLRR